ncbi:MAG TPA: DUF885 domain-containing protein, partial [Longilinea sp.]|nr:DUF885 domain-containing protein [Longilinea sp.]
LKEGLAILRSYDLNKQTPTQQLSTKILDYFMDIQARGEKFMYHDYPLNQMFGLQSEFPNFMTTLHPVNNALNARNYIKRLNKVGIKFDQTLEGLRIREEKGVIPPRFVIRRVLDEMTAFIKTPITDNSLYTVYAEKLAKLKLDKTRQQGLLADTEKSIGTVVYPAYQRLIDYFTTLEPKATDDDGLWKLPDGDACYAYQLRSNTTTEFTPQEVHEIGLSEVDRIETEMRGILKGLGLPTNKIAKTIQELSKDPRFLYPNTDEGRAEALAEYQRIIDHVNQNLDNLFDLRPAVGVKVERIPEFREKTSAGAYYMLPSMDGKRPGVFYANLRDMNEVVKFGMRTLAYHEAIPGHHFQLSIAQGLKGLPTFRRILPFTAYIEGWALYAEKLARENGFMEDTYSELGYLQSELFRSVRLVVDTGIHFKRWTRQQAIDYMIEHTGMPDASVVSEIERYIVMPGQACAYKLGEIKIVQLRQKALKTLGDSFNIKKFHNTVLKNGAMPLYLLEQEIDRYIQQELKHGETGAI